MIISENIHCWVFNNVPLFSDLSVDHKMDMHAALKEQKFHKNELIVKEGTLMNHLYIVRTGRVRICKQEEGKESIKHILQPGDVFGEFGIIAPETYIQFTNSVRAMDNDTIVYAFPYEVMERICKEDRKGIHKLVLNAMFKYKQLDQRLGSVVLKKSRDRIIDFIKELAHEIGKPIGYEMLIKHNLTHQEIADITGISRQKVTTILNELKQEGLIHLERNSILIHEMNLLD
ncbi:MAG: Crp/Fnr family transcriptional regulator [Brumimicrobium sp.]|nr:Crp/Fnr family transcriptional regulator [Brumimicrobium sp.]